MKMKSRLKSILSVALSIAMLATIMPGKTVLAEENTEKYPYMMFAASSSDGAITINSNSFNASGNIATNGTVVSGGTLNVNGTKTEHANEEMINVVKKLNNSYFNADAVERYSDDYSLEEINININDPIDVYGNVELIGNISLNSSIKASEDININGEVINANNAVICSETGDININTSNVNFSGLIYAPYGNITINADNLNLNSVIVIGQTITIDCPNANVGYNNSMGEFVGTESDIDAMIFAYGEYNSDANAIDIEWITNYTNSNYEIWVSDDNIEYSSVAVVSDETTYQYTITEDFEIKYFKVSLSTKYGELIESIPIVITKTDEGYSVEYLDSDNDGIPDVFENTIGTDINNVDSDNDGLTDYEEVYITGTDPTKYDSVSEGVSDADADSDNDRLSNKEEIELGTDPQKADTDNDGLSDYDEIYVYGTDPLVPDTDNDGIKDGDELNIGLDPTNPETFDVPDAEYVSKQIISADSDVLKEINTENSPYQLSVEVESTGYVEGNLTVSETRYSKAINNGAILGIAPELICDNSCNISKVVIQFDISDAYVENELYTSSDVLEVKGLERLLIFKYFEDYNMLLPIETQYDLENNVIYAEVDELGTYCIMNMEKLTSSLDLGDATEDENEIMTASIESSMPIIDDKNFTEEDTRVVFSEEKLAETNNEEILAISDNLSAAIASVSTIKTTDVHTPIDVAFLIQTSGQLESTFKSQCTMIGNLMDLLIEKYGEGNVRFCLITYGLNGAEALNFTADGDVWFTKSVAVKFALNSLQYVYTSGYTDRGNAFKYLQNNITFKETSAKYIIQVMNGSTDVGSLYFDQINMCANLGINYSELMPANYKYINPSYGEQVDNAISSTGGLNLTYGTDTENKLYRHIVNKTPKARVKYKVILPTSWSTEIVLDDIISPDNGTDTDSDGLTDWKEINTEDGLISWDTNGSIKLPTINECIGKVRDDGYLYVLDEYDDYLIRNFSESIRSDIFNCRTLPIHSNPCDSDSDGDSVTDYYDANQLQYNELSDLFIDLINDGNLHMSDIISSDDGFSIAYKPLSDIFQDYGIDYIATEENNVDKYFDDWYIFSIKSNNNTRYSILKMRELTNEDSAVGVAIPFIELNTDLFRGVIYNHLNESELNTHLNDIATGTVTIHGYSEEIASYFANPMAQANYIIPELYIDKVIKEDGKTGIIKFSKKSIKKRQKKFLKSLGAMYDELNSVITINDINNLSLEEKQAILAIRTGNTSFNSFAAEVVYHAEYAISSAKAAKFYEDAMSMSMYYVEDYAIAYAASLRIFISAVKADMCAAEEIESGFTDASYYNENGKHLKQQQQLWGQF